jgi:hypothetical protein
MRTILFFLMIFVITAGTISAQDSLSTRPDSLRKASFSRDLSGVTVVAAKPLIEKKLDRIVVNVERMITASAGTAMDILGKLPGVSVDAEGAIRYNNKAGVLVYLDNKPTYLSGNELSNLLQNMSANEIESVEIIPNPPAKYDAAGNAGVLNIKTKKGLKRGTNGNLTAGFSQGEMPRENIALSLNHRTEKWNFFGNLTAQDRRNKSKQRNERTFAGDEKPQHVNGRDAISQHFWSEGLKLGADYFLSKRTTIGVLANASLLNGNVHSNTITDVLLADSLTERLNTQTAFDMDRQRLTGNLNFRQTFQKAGQELSADLDYLYYRSMINQQINTRFYNASAEETAVPLQLQSTSPVDINVWSGKVDYIHPLRENMRIEAGVKTTNVSNNNLLNYLRVQEGKWIEDARSNEFKYTESVNAAYINYAATLGKFTLQAGLRAEHTHGEGKQQRGGMQFTRDTLNFFPTLFLQYTLSEKHSIGFNYGRRIERPQYELLNPFIILLDTLTAEQGNPALRPQYVNNFGLNYTYDRSLQFSFGYNVINDVMSKIAQQVPGEKITIFMFQNISRLRTITGSVTYSAAIAPWWQASYYAAAIHTNYKGVASGTNVSLHNTAFNGNITNSFQWKRGWSAELSAIYNGRYLNEFLGIAAPVLGLNLGLAKSLWENKAKIQLSVNDITRPSYRMRTQYGNVDMYNSYVGDSRRVGLTFTWKFGKTTVERERQRATGTRDVESRLKN